MTIDIITLFPKMFKGVFNESIVKRAIDKDILTINIHDLRRFAIDKRGTVDERPYGGGPGMLLRPEPIFLAVEKITKRYPLNAKPLNILLDAAGALYNQKTAWRYSTLDQIVLICGHYEGVDYRVHKHLADEVVSIGDYILTGGEIAAMIIADSITRLIPGVLKKQEAVKFESFQNNSALLEYPQYTRPENFKGYKVPKILLSGNHKKIEEWRKKQALKRTKKYRPEVLKQK